MKAVLEQLEQWPQDPEGEHLEFKEAKSRYDFEELVKYCCALANDRGGQMILGVTDRRPRRIVGTSAFESLERTKKGLVERLHIRIEAEDLKHPDGHVLVFHVPSGPVGVPFQCQRIPGTPYKTRWRQEPRWIAV
jgi:ATP-dependent DNA helicase RecG